MERTQWTTTFRDDLRKQVNILAAELGVKPNHVLEIGFMMLHDKYKQNEANVYPYTKFYVKNK